MARWIALLLLVAVVFSGADGGKSEGSDWGSDSAYPPNSGYYYASPPPPTPPSCGESPASPPTSPPSCQNCTSTPSSPPPSPSPSPSCDTCHKPPSPPPCKCACECKCEAPPPRCPEVVCPAPKPCHKCMECPKPKPCDQCMECPKPNPYKCPDCMPCDSSAPPPSSSECSSCKSCGQMMQGVDFSESDAELMNNILNVEYLMSKYYSQGADSLKDDDIVKSLVADFSSQTTTHISMLTQLLKNYTMSKPESVDVSPAVFSKIADAALGQSINSNFDAYKSSTNFLLAASVTAPIASTMSTDSIPELEGKSAKAVVADISAHLAAQKATMMLLLSQRAGQTVSGLNMTVAQFSAKLSELEKKLDRQNEAKVASAKTTTLRVTVKGTHSPLAGAKAAQSMLQELGFYTADKHH